MDRGGDQTESWYGGEQWGCLQIWCCWLEESCQPSLEEVFYNILRSTDSNHCHFLLVTGSVGWRPADVRQTQDETTGHWTVTTSTEPDHFTRSLCVFCGTPSQRLCEPLCAFFQGPLLMVVVWCLSIDERQTKSSLVKGRGQMLFLHGYQQGLRLLMTSVRVESIHLQWLFCRAWSVTWNPHKMMGVPLQCSAILVKKRVRNFPLLFKSTLENTQWQTLKAFRWKLVLL